MGRKRKTTWDGGERIPVKVICLAEGPVGQATNKRVRRVGVTWCGVAGCPGPARCNACHAAYSRARRRKGRDTWRRNPAIARAKALISMRLHRGTMKKGECEVCGKAGHTFHQPDPTTPLSLYWRCKAHPRKA